MKYPVALTVNGRLYRGEVEARTLLVHFLRDDLGLTGTHVGCETSSCGACTVLCDGKALKSCSRLAVQADGSKILTIEGLPDEARRQEIATECGLHPVQQAFLEHAALQCGYCAPAALFATVELLERGQPLDEELIRRGLDGTVCRCTGYQSMVEAIRGSVKSPVWQGSLSVPSRSSEQAT